VLSAIEFKNFKALRDATLPLSPFTLLLGPNGSGKSSVLQALEAIASSSNLDVRAVASAGAALDVGDPIRVVLKWAHPAAITHIIASWDKDNRFKLDYIPSPGVVFDATAAERSTLWERLRSMRVYAFDANSIANPVQIGPNVQLERNGAGLAGVLDQMRDEDENRFDALNEEMSRWLPEYDRIVLERPANGCKSILLQTKEGGHRIPAAHLSQGTLLALALLTLAHLPNPPFLVGLEEPDRGLHPRLLRELRDALYRLSYPESFGESRKPVQVIVTSHSPYLLDLYREHPEEVVLAQKCGLDVHFERLADKPDFDEILGDAPLSEVWYSGILGGVPSPS
jgi:predicted ATPase